MIVILKYLSKEKESSYKEIENVTGIKERNIRYDIERINDILSLKKLPIITKGSKGGLIFPEGADFNQLENDGEYIYSQEERVSLMLLTLLFDKENFKLSSFSKEFYISRSTSKRDLKLLEYYLSEKDIKLEYSNGFSVIGNEKSISLIMKEEIVKYIYLFIENKERLNVCEQYCKKVIQNSFEDTNIREIINWVKDLLNGVKCVLTDESFKWYVGSILVFCLFEKHSVSYPIDDDMKIHNKNIIDNDKTYDLYIKKLEKIIKHKINKSDVETVIWLLYYANKYSYDLNESYSLIDIEAIVANLIELMSKELNINFEKDLILSAGLINHITPLINRIKNGLVIQEDIKSLLNGSDFTVCDAVKKVIRKISILDDMNNENEIAYIAIHFIASMKRINEGVTKKILIICRFGYGTSIMIKEALTSQYNVKIVDTIPAYKLNEYKNRNDIDIIVSTSELNDVDKPVIVVNSLSDIENTEKLQKYGIITKKIMNMYNSINKKLCFLTDEQRVKVMEVLNSELGYHYARNVKKINKLTDILQKDSIEYIDYDLKWEKALDAASKILEVKGYIDHKYKDNIIECINKFGFYSVMDDGFALLHGNKSEYIFRTSMSLIVSKKPIKFGNKKVNVLFCFGSKDKKDSISALVVLMRIIKNTDFLKDVVKYTDKAEIFNLIKECELEVL